MKNSLVGASSLTTRATGGRGNDKHANPRQRFTPGLISRRGRAPLRRDPHLRHDAAPAASQGQASLCMTRGVPRWTGRPRGETRWGTGRSAVAPSGRAGCGVGWSGVQLAAQAGEHDAQSLVEFGGAVVGGQHGGQGAEPGELGQR